MTGRIRSIRTQEEADEFNRTRSAVFVPGRAPVVKEYTLAEAAPLLGVAPVTLRKQVYEGRLTARLVGRAYIVTVGEIERYRRESAGKPGRRRAAK